MSSTATRRPPNAMNFIRQLEILKKSGEESDFTADRLLFFFSCAFNSCLGPDARLRLPVKSIRGEQR